MKSSNRSSKMRAARLLFWRVSTFSGVRYACGVKVRADITTSSCKPTEWGFPMYRVAEGVRSTHGQDGAIVLDIRHGQMFNANLVGSRILELLESGSAQPEIIEEIIREFGVNRPLAENDVQDFLQSLTKYQLIESSDRG
ncbi:MAG TPA: PqqD family protein [Candidatus Sulfotelmatobacter sp.]|nr:PqqD family protein [Candidatus Sulfotelmatobacter sp.]